MIIPDHQRIDRFKYLGFWSYRVLFIDATSWLQHRSLIITMVCESSVCFTSLNRPKIEALIQGSAGYPVSLPLKWSSRGTKWTSILSQFRFRLTYMSQILYVSCHSFVLRSAGLSQCFILSNTDAHHWSCQHWWILCSKNLICIEIILSRRGSFSTVCFLRLKENGFGQEGFLSN